MTSLHKHSARASWWGLERGIADKSKLPTIPLDLPENPAGQRLPRYAEDVKGYPQMAWIPIYADELDFKIICDWLNGQEEIAFLVANGDKRWIAKSRIDNLCPEPVQQYQLWHIPSGPLPLLGETNKDPDGIVENPWEGWTEKRTGAHYWVPYFGAGHPGVITLTVKTVCREATESIGLSDFGWIGNWYRTVGSPAHPTTEKFWQKLRRWIKKQSIRIPRTGPPDGPNPEIWTFSSAYEKIKKGMHRDMNP